MRHDERLTSLFPGRKSRVMNDEERLKSIFGGFAEIVEDYPLEQRLDAVARLVAGWVVRTKYPMVAVRYINEAIRRAVGEHLYEQRQGLATVPPVPPEEPTRDIPSHDQEPGLE